MTTYGSATANVDTEEAARLILGKPQEEASALLMENLPLAQPPVITVKPDWFPYIPFLPIRTVIEIVPVDWQG